MNKKQDTKKRIERAAIELIAAHGADGVSMRDIARAIDVSEPAIYRHYTNKDTLVWEVFTTNYDIFAANLEMLQCEHQSFKGKLTAMVDGCCELFDTDRDLFTFLLLAQHIQRGVSSDYEAALPQLLERLVCEAINNNEIPPQDTELSVAMIIGCVLQPALHCIYHRDQPKYMTPFSAALSASCWRIVQGV
jgi:AcrR family transcriptional regulator